MVRDLVDYLARKVVDDPGAVEVLTKGDREVTYLIQVARGEEGRVIGKNGRVIQAIRTLARAAAGPRERVQVDVVSADGTGQGPGAAEELDPDGD